jgi:hypothetical protein
LNVASMVCRFSLKAAVTMPDSGVHGCSSNLEATEVPECHS